MFMLLLGNIKFYRIENSEMMPLDILSLLKLQVDCGISNWTAAQYQEEIKREDSIIWLAKFEDEPLGFIAGRLSPMVRAEEAASDSIKSGAELDIVNLCVIGKYRRIGIGNRLIDNILKIDYAGRKVQTVWLEVRESNAAAIYFYEKKGFLKTQIRKNFYRDPAENAFVMKLDLRTSESKL